MKRSAFRSLAIKLGIVLAVGAASLPAARLASRWYFAQALAERAFEGGERSLVPELARLDRDAIGPLVSASTNPDPAIAEPARAEIDRLLRQWRRDSRDEHYDAAGRRLTLASELDRQSRDFSPTGQQWLAGVAERLLDDDAAGATSLQLVRLCDRLLSASQRRTDVIDLPRAPAVAAKRSPASKNASLALPETLPAEVALSDRVSSSPDPSTKRPVAATPLPPPQASELYLAGPVPPLNQPEQAPEPLPAEPPLLAPPPVAGPLAASPPREAAGGLPWQSPSRSAPTARGPAAFPKASLVSDPFTELPLTLLTLSSLPDRELLAAGLESQYQLPRALLITRGFGEATHGELAAAISPDEAERLMLAKQLLASPTGGAARMLFLLASDPSSQVRATAIAALGSSPDRRLVEVAWRMALRDPDARVARLANELKPR